MKLTEKEIKNFVYYGTVNNKQVCDLTINNGKTIPHLDWALITAFDELDKNTIWSGKEVEEILFKRIENLIKFCKENE